MERGPGEWHPFWSSERAPEAWRAPDEDVAAALRWRRSGPGVEWASLQLRGDRPGLVFGVLVARLDPSVLHFELARPADPGRGWSVADAPPAAAVALNAGQFEGRAPWGWLVVGGVEAQPPRPGPLSQAFVVGPDGSARLVPEAEIAGLREGGARPRLAFQSYPSLLVGDGEVPAPLRAPGRGVDVVHRDLRLALGELPDGRLLVVLTRYRAVGSPLGRLPLGPTVPETAALMGALGCRRAVALDGGLSGQLLLRGPGDATNAWPGLRTVPLGLVARPSGAP